MNNTIRFYRVDDDYGIFSNFSNHPIEVDGIIWKTSEHYFQAQKFHDEKTRLKVINAASPGEAAKIGRDRNNILRNEWEQIKDDVMRKAVLAKVMQHEDVRKLLISTGMLQKNMTIYMQLLGLFQYTLH